MLFLSCPTHDVLFASVLADQCVHGHGLQLVNSVHSVCRLLMDLRVPVCVYKHNLRGPSQVQTNSTSSRGHDKREYQFVRVEPVHQHLPGLGRSLAVHAVVPIILVVQE